jgi:hypothetical protein
MHQAKPLDKTLVSPISNSFFKYKKLKITSLSVHDQFAIAGP